ncbi:MAG TPA: tRNA pseudouridine(38-40) synthase TruA, partial [Alphaproteobacteria bacterium]|nr:tRNA pseudouridine(38-40) synthase TruA [Alphaproteobacteria bacterium]
MTRRILIIVEYDGGPFYGWQRQIDGPTVQQVLEQAAAALTGSETLVQGAGRTDSGVHATGQAAHLDVPDKFDAERVMQALNALTGDHPVSVLSAREVPADFHARFSATG